MFKPLAQADLVVLVVDGTDPLPEIRDKISTCRRVVTDRDIASTIIALTKIDWGDTDTVYEKQAALETFLPPLLSR
jgi:GTP-binding protein HflX